MPSEFDIIKRYFYNIAFAKIAPSLAVGDDAAIIDIPEGLSLAVSVDTLISGVHFFADDPPEAIAHKAVAVNLSDMAAMGATPQWITLALTLPDVNEAWLQGFQRGLIAVCKQFKVSLIGGDTTQGPLSLTVQVKGLVPKGKHMTRSGAQVGDAIMVSGFIGDAGAGLKIRQGQCSVSQTKAREYLINRLRYPTPRVALGECLRGYATAAIDVSDGLLADLKHILKASGVGARLDLEALPLSQAYKNSTTAEEPYSLALSAGDDYELCFTVPEKHMSDIQTLAETLNFPLTKIGCIEKQVLGLRCFLQRSAHNFDTMGYRHF